MADTVLRDALTTPAIGEETTGTVSRVNANGSVDVDLGGGQITEQVPVLSSAWVPSSGTSVALLKYSQSQFLVLGPLRTSNATTVTLTSSLTFSYNVTPGAPAVPNPLIVDPVATGSYRGSWEGGDVKQGAYAGYQQYGYFRGLYIYGDVFGVLAGRSCTAITIEEERSNQGGAGGATPMFIGPHVHASIPGDVPYFPWGATDVGSLGWSDGSNPTQLSLPTWMGNYLINRQAYGLGHEYLGTTYYSINRPRGRVRIWWA